MAKKAKLPADTNKRAKSIVDLATGEGDSTKDANMSGKNPAAVALGKLGGKSGGPARAKALSEERRSEIAKKAAQKRWHKN
jgi:hypothetical protein